MGNVRFEEQKKKDNRKIINETFASKIEEKKKAVIKSTLIDVITLAIGVGLSEKIIKMLPLRQMY